MQVWELAALNIPFCPWNSLLALGLYVLSIAYVLTQADSLSESFKAVSGSNPQRLLINNSITACLHQRVLKTVVFSLGLQTLSDLKNKQND